MPEREKPAKARGPRPGRGGAQPGRELVEPEKIGADVLGFDALTTRLRQAAFGAEAASFGGLLALWRPSLDR